MAGYLVIYGSQTGQVGPSLFGPNVTVVSPRSPAEPVACHPLWDEKVKPATFQALGKGLLRPDPTSPKVLVDP